MLIYIAHHRKK